MSDEKPTPGEIATRQSIAQIEASDLSDRTKTIIGGYALPAFLDAAPAAHHYLSQVAPEERTAAAHLTAKILGDTMAEALMLDMGAKTS